LFPKALVTGWKFEARVEGIPSQQREEALAAASLQIANCGSDACVLNGPAYGEGFGHVGKNGDLTHLQDAHTLCAFLAGILSR
jgi:phosphopantothenoylcysteine decarboxylase/phosphopantothenate--cysteine ligase